MTKKIEFQRVIRDCPANDGETNPRQLIADFDVLVDGEHLATFWRDYRGRGYDLQDRNGDKVYPRPPDYLEYRPDTVHADKKADFQGLTEAALKNGRIPSIADCAARMAGWGRALLDKRDVEDAEARASVIQDCAADLYELTTMVATRSAGVSAAGALLGKIEAKVKERIAYHRENDGFNKYEAEAVKAFEDSQAGAA